jgi:hypothetical protein
MPSGCVPGRQARSKSISMPGLIWRVVIQTKYPSMMASSPAGAAGIDASGNPFQRFFPGRQTPPPTACGQTAGLPHAPATASNTTATRSRPQKSTGTVPR